MEGRVAEQSREKRKRKGYKGIFERQQLQDKGEDLQGTSLSLPPHLTKCPPTSYLSILTNFQMLLLCLFLLF